MKLDELRQKKIRIMYLDDDAYMLEVVQTLLNGAGYETGVTRYPTELLSMVDQGCDLMILDLVWPEMEHLDVCMDLLRDGYTGKIMITSARNLLIEQWDIFNGLGFSLLMKPFGPRDLIQHVRQALVSS